MLKCGTERSRASSQAAVEKIRTDCLVLACGHSARPVFDMLAALGVSLAPKPFSVGVRIEHLQRDIDDAMYGAYAGHPLLVRPNTRCRTVAESAACTPSACVPAARLSPPQAKPEA